MDENRDTALPSAFNFWVDDMATKGIPGWKVAKMLGITRVYLQKIKAGEYPPGRALAKKIQDLSGGSVPMTIWDA